MKTKRSFSCALISSLLVLSALQGCSDDDGNPTPPDVTPTAGRSSSGGRSGSSSGGSGNKAGTKASPEGGGGGTDTTDGGAPPETPIAGQAGQGGDGPVEPTCDPLTGADGCFNCPKDGEVEQWLNRCVESDCEPFDNAERLPLLKPDGSLPALPN